MGLRRIRLIWNLLFIWKCLIFLCEYYLIFCCSWIGKILIFASISAISLISLIYLGILFVYSWLISARWSFSLCLFLSDFIELMKVSILIMHFKFLSEVLSSWYGVNLLVFSYYSFTDILLFSSRKKLSDCSLFVPKCSSNPSSSTIDRSCDD